MKLQLQKLEKNKFFIFYNVEFVLEKAVELMISGFCREIFTKLPLEFAAEADKLLTLKLEGSVG
jgi:Fe-S cluster assembly protein SufB